MDQAIKKVREKICNTYINKSGKDSNKSRHYNCTECKDTGFIFDKETNSGKLCKCQELKMYEERLERSRIKKTFLSKNFDNYEARTDEQIKIKKLAVDYAEEFNQNKDSIMFLGSVGAGKTHLTVAIANKLMKNKIPVLYMNYVDDMLKLKQSILDADNYNTELNKYKNAKVLLVDDLFKGAIKNGQVNDTDIRILFGIINHRYVNDLPIIVSSECWPEDLMDYDEAVASRLLEMAKGHIAVFEETENYRICGDKNGKTK